jgi:hypothetical protein
MTCAKCKDNNFTNTYQVQYNDKIFKNLLKISYSNFFLSRPVRIRVRIDPPHPHVCRKRRLIGAVIRMRPEKPRSRVTVSVAR